LGFCPALSPAADAFSHVVNEYLHHSKQYDYSANQPVKRPFFVPFGPGRRRELLDLGNVGRKGVGF
jgi:hypothetical protein